MNVIIIFHRLNQYWPSILSLILISQLFQILEHMISESNSECKKMKYSFNESCIPQLTIQGKNGERISYLVSLVWSQDWKERTQYRGQIPYTKCTEIAEKDILGDLESRGLKLRIGRKIIVRLVSAHQIRKQSEKQFCFQGVIIQNKINLPKGYSYLPNQFDGFIIQGLSIANQFGSITWANPLSIQGIDFSSGIKISEDSIQCNHQQLLKDVIVEFFKVPACIEQKLSLGDKKIALEKLKKKVEKTRSCKFLKYDEINKHWYVLMRMGYLLK